MLASWLLPIRQNEVRTHFVPQIALSYNRTDRLFFPFFITRRQDCRWHAVNFLLKEPPSKERAPASNVSRRVKPSQHHRGLPSILIIGFPLNRTLGEAGMHHIVAWQKA